MGKVQPSISKFFLRTSVKPSEVESIDLTEEGEELPQQKRKLRAENELEVHKRPRRGCNDAVAIVSTENLGYNSDNIEPEDIIKEDNGLVEVEAKEEATYVDDLDTVDQTKRRSKKVSTLKASAKPAQTKSKSKAYKLTPLEGQVVKLKRDHPDKVLAIQVGYKFKFFGPDAVVVAKILNIMLVPGKTAIDTLESPPTFTNTNPNADDRIAYCLIPDNRLHVHLQRLLSNGLKVGVIKQTETAAIKQVDGNKNSLFERQLTGVYTKATYMDDEQLDLNGYSDDSSSGSGRYILCIDDSMLSKSDQNYSLVAVLPLTGEIFHELLKDNVSLNELETRLTYLQPSEVLVSTSKDKGEDKPLMSKELRKVLYISGITGTPIVVESKSAEVCVSKLNELFSADVADYYTLLPSSTQACVVELAIYLQEFKLSEVFTICSNVRHFSDARHHMLLPANTLKSLEIFQNSNNSASEKGSLFWILNHTRTKMGERLLRKWISQPLTNRQDIQERLDSVEDLLSGFNHFVESMLKQLEKISKSGLDFEKTMIKIHYAASYKMDKIGRRETYNFLRILSEILQLIKRFEEQIHDMKVSKLLKKIFRDLLECSEKKTIHEFVAMINPSGAFETDIPTQKVTFFKHKWEQIEFVKAQIEEYEAQMEEEIIKIRKLLKRPQLNYVTNMKETHLIEVRNGAMTKNLPLDWIKINSTKTVSRFRTPEITKILKNLNYHKEMLVQACDNAYNEFLTKVDSEYEYVRRIVSSLLVLDCLLSLSAASMVGKNLCKPEFVDSPTIEVKQGRNPIIETLKHDYIANDITMSQEAQRCVIVTGPNMGGKSSYVRQVALIVIMAQIGCYVPCESAKLGVFDSIFTRMGAQDNIIRGESTFMIELLECSYIIQNVTERSLVILDEIGRGTGTTDGISIAYSILDYFINAKCLTLFITHYPSLHVFSNLYLGLVENYHMGFIERSSSKNEDDWPEIVFLYTLVKGVVKNLYGINVAKLAGISQDIVLAAFKKSLELREDIEFADAIRFGNNMAQILLEGKRDATYEKLQYLSATIE